VVKHYVRTQSLKALATSSASVRIQPETRLLWLLAEEMGSSSSFDSLDACAPVPDAFTQSVVPKCISSPRGIPVEVFTASVDATGVPSTLRLGTTVADTVQVDVAEEFRSKRRPMKKSKTVDNGAASRNHVSEEQKLPGSSWNGDSDDDFVPRLEASKSAPAGALFTPLTQSLTPGGPVPDTPLGLDDWKKARHRTVISSQAACCDAGVPLLQQLKPNFIILYDPEPELVQEIEVYRNYHAPDVVLRVYVLVHTGSADHMRYLHFLKAEKEVLITPQ
jgi:hypothetical protein